MRRLAIAVGLLLALAGSASAVPPPPAAVVALGSGSGAWATSRDPAIESHLLRLSAAERCKQCVSGDSLASRGFRMADLEGAARRAVRISRAAYVTLEPGARDICDHVSLRAFEASLSRGLAILTRGAESNLVLLLSVPRTRCGSPGAYNRTLAKTCFRFRFCLYDRGAMWRLSLGPGAVTQHRIAALEWPVALRLLGAGG